MKYVIVGTGSRSELFISALVNEYKDEHELVGLCDSNPQRISYYQNWIGSQNQNLKVKGFNSDDFDFMITSMKPDVVIVTTVDARHHEYIIRALELGCNVITEKPMTTTEKHCHLILKAVEQTGLDVRVAFNYRWGVGVSRVKEILHDSIGPIHHVSLQYLLDTDHGADYFRRWHRNREMSGGLLIHKATHHFDLVNWWTDSVPETVFGIGKLAFYGDGNGPARLYSNQSESSSNGTYHNPFQIDLSSTDKFRGLYQEAQRLDGYRRDMNVFGTGINIEDTMSVIVGYRTGIHLSYSLIAYSSMEGFVVTFHGDKGRLKYEEIHRPRTRIDETGRSIDTDEDEWSSAITVQHLFQQAKEEKIEISPGGHGGADPLMLKSLFEYEAHRDPLGRVAGHQQGAASMLIGAAANHSIGSGNSINISELCPELGSASKLSDLI
ncbi:MAG: Gfo/Idh/MocA family oxidoreductase [Chloroflexota bacterium]|nr:Gfo/Idh/MocA family oxidoreductase [Chloroflexota bacterium]